MADRAQPDLELFYPPPNQYTEKQNGLNTLNRRRRWNCHIWQFVKISLSNDVRCIHDDFNIVAFFHSSRLHLFKKIFEKRCIDVLHLEIFAFNEIFLLSFSSLIAFLSAFFCIYKWNGSRAPYWLMCCILSSWRKSKKNKYAFKIYRYISYDKRLFFRCLCRCKGKGISENKVSYIIIWYILSNKTFAERLTVETF